MDLDLRVEETKKRIRELNEKMDNEKDQLTEKERTSIKNTMIALKNRTKIRVK
jgi:hypothetical protein